MLKKLIGSRTRINILKLFVLNPKQDYYVRGIARLTKEPFDPVRRELMQLETVGIFKSPKIFLKGDENGFRKLV